MHHASERSFSIYAIAQNSIRLTCPSQFYFHPCLYEDDVYWPPSVIYTTTSKKDVSHIEHHIYVYIWLQEQYASEASRHNNIGRL